MREIKSTDLRISFLTKMDIETFRKLTTNF